MRRILRYTLLPGLLLCAPAALAQLPGIISQPLAHGGQSWSLPVQTLVFLTSLSFLPAMLLLMTSFTRIIIVLGLLRNALGTPSAPPNQVLLGLALFLTFFIMSPVLDKIYQDAYQPFSEQKISMETALERGAKPPARLHAAPDARDRSSPVCSPGETAADAGAGRCPAAHPAAGLCHQRVEDGVPDRLYRLHSVPDHRPGGRQRIDGAGDDDGPANHHLAAL